MQNCGRGMGGGVGAMGWSEVSILAHIRTHGLITDHVEQKYQKKYWILAD